MTEDERRLLVQTAKAVAAVAHGLAVGYERSDFTEQYLKINRDLCELATRVAPELLG